MRRAYITSTLLPTLDGKGWALGEPIRRLWEGGEEGARELAAVDGQPRGATAATRAALAEALRHAAELRVSLGPPPVWADPP